MKNSIILFLASIVLLSCKKDVIIPPEPFPELSSIDTTGFLEIHVDNMVGNLPLILGSTNYVNSANDTFNVNIYKYYLSNVQLVSSNGLTYTEVESYYLIDQSNPNSLHLMVKKVPAGSYSSIRFLIGVDAPRNTAGAQTGALDPMNDMFWGWNTGYIMAKMEGHSPQSSEQTNKIVYHIGGFEGKDNALRTVNLVFPNSANCTQNHTPILSIKADLGAWFASPNFDNFNNSNVITGITSESSAIADNYANMFTVTSVVN
jgi:hypothetical protein